LNEAGNICAHHILDVSGEWVDENSASNVELRPLLAFHNDTSTLRELIAELQEAVDALDMVPRLDYEEQTNAA